MNLEKLKGIFITIMREKFLQKNRVNHVFVAGKYCSLRSISPWGGGPGQIFQ
jgi:hypothetical protein